MNFLKLAVCSLFLLIAGCINVSVPIYNEDEAVFPFPDSGYLIALPSAKAFSFVRDRKGYTFKEVQKGTTYPVKFFRPDKLGGLYLAQTQFTGRRLQPILILEIDRKGGRFYPSPEKSFKGMPDSTRPPAIDRSPKADPTVVRNQIVANIEMFLKLTNSLEKIRNSPDVTTFTIYHNKDEFDKALPVAITTAQKHKTDKTENEEAKLSKSGVRSILKRADKTRINRDYEEAILQYNRILDKKPKHKEALYGRAQSYGSAKNYAKAFADYEQLLSAHPDFARARHDMGFLYYLKKDHKAAITVFTEQLSREDAKLWWNSGLRWRAESFQALGKNKAALRDYRARAERTPGNVNSHNHLGDFLTEIGQYDAAAKAYSNGIAVASNDTSAVNFEFKFKDGNEHHLPYLLKKRARAYGHLKDNQKAYDDYDAIVALKQDDPMALLDRGEALNKLERFEDAISDYNAVERLLKSTEKVPSKKVLAILYWLRSYALLKVKRADDAVNDLNEYIKLEPRDSTAFNNRGIGYRMLGENAKADADFARAAQLKKK